jgi:hypothetical protein
VKKLAGAVGELLAAAAAACGGGWWWWVVSCGVGCWSCCPLWVGGGEAGQGGRGPSVMRPPPVMLSSL